MDTLYSYRQNNSCQSFLKQVHFVTVKCVRPSANFCLMFKGILNVRLINIASELDRRPFRYLNACAGRLL